MYGEDSLEKVVDELDKIHTKKHAGKFDIKILDVKSDGNEKTKRKTRSPDKIIAKKKKETLIL
jgi:hypothetical protein